MIIRRMEQVDFSRADRVTLTHQPWLAPCDVSARAAMLIVDDRLHVRMEAEEANIRAEETDPLASVCRDSCLELFLAPDPEDIRYFNIEWNPAGNVYLGFGGPRETRVRQILRDPRGLFRFSSFRTEDGWGITYSIPESFLRMYFPDFRMGQAMMGNLYKCGDATVSPHYLAWMPLSSGTPDFHRRQDFGHFTVE